MVNEILQWFASRGWTVFGFQRKVWTAMRRGNSGLLHVTTGAGKTYAVWFGALLRGAQLNKGAKTSDHRL